jgi:hypothetical protein
MVEAIEHCFILWCLAFQGYGWRMENNYSKSLDMINIGRGANGSFAKDVLIDVSLFDLQAIFDFGRKYVS